MWSGSYADTPGDIGPEEWHATINVACGCESLRRQCSELAAELGATTAARAELYEARLCAIGALVTAMRERDNLRALAAEILAALGPRPNGISNPQIAKWRKRAGLE